MFQRALTFRSLPTRGNSFSNRWRYVSKVANRNIFAIAQDKTSKSALQEIGTFEANFLKRTTWSTVKALGVTAATATISVPLFADLIPYAGPEAVFGTLIASIVGSFGSIC